MLWVPLPILYGYYQLFTSWISYFVYVFGNWSSCLNLPVVVVLLSEPCAETVRSSRNLWVHKGETNYVRDSSGLTLPRYVLVGNKTFAERN